MLTQHANPGLSGLTLLPSRGRYFLRNAYFPGVSQKCEKVDQIFLGLSGETRLVWKGLYKDCVWVKRLWLWLLALATVCRFNEEECSDPSQSCSCQPGMQSWMLIEHTMLSSCHFCLLQCRYRHDVMSTGWSQARYYPGLINNIKSLSAGYPTLYKPANRWLTACFVSRTNLAHEASLLVPLRGDSLHRRQWTVVGKHWFMKRPRCSQRSYNHGSLQRGELPHL